MDKQPKIVILSAPTQAAFEVIVPFDRVTGKVYLNAIGATRNEAELPFAAGAIEMSEEELDSLDFIPSALMMALGSEPDPTLFPVSVPIDRETGKPLLSATGSNDTEARVNLDFLNKDADAYSFASCGIKMPQLLESQPSQVKLGQ
jgi:hypothetical protein